MKKLRWQILIVLLTLVVVGILIIRQQPGAITIFPQPASGGIYTEGMVGSLQRLNPLFDRNNQVDQDIDKLIFSGLISFDSKGLPVPDLAESWGVSLDGTIYNISIRQNAVWQDGQPVTSDDVVFTINLIQNKVSAYPDDVRNLWKEIKVTTLDPKTLRFELSEPYAPFLDYLVFGILPKHILDPISPDNLATADFNLHPVGSGPFQFDSLKTKNGHIDGVVLKAFPAFYGQKPYIEQVEFNFYPTSMDAFLAYQQGEILGISQISTDILNSALSQPNLSVYTSRLPRITMVLFNLKNQDVPFLQDKDLRNALLTGLNRQLIIDQILKGQAIQANSPILPGNWAYYEGVQKAIYDLDQAISMLKVAGYALGNDGSGIRKKDNASLSFTLLHPDDQIHTDIAKAIQSDWAALGVQVTLKAVSYEDLLNNYLTSRDFQAALVDLDLTNMHDPDPYPFWHQAEATGGQNYSQWDNRTASEYLEQARVIVDSSLRAKLYRNFQIIFAKETPAILLYYPVFSFGVDSQVSGIQIPQLYETSDRFIGINNWYLVTKHTIGNVTTVTP